MSWRTLKKILLSILAGLAFLFLALLGAVYYHSGIDQIRSVDAIIVLGAGQWDGRPSPMFQARLDRAFDLYNQGYAAYLVLTGGFGTGEENSESDVGKNYLVEKGVSENVIFIEKQSRTTWQNLNNARNILESISANSVLLVSHDFHMMRSQKMARDLDIQAFAAPVATESPAAKFKFLTREAYMYIIYILFKI